MDTSTGPSMGLLGLFLAASCLMARIHAGSFFDDSMSLPLPTCLFDPLGAGSPYTRKVIMLLKMVVAFLVVGGRSAMLGRLRSAFRWGRTGRSPCGL